MGGSGDIGVHGEAALVALADAALGNSDAVLAQARTKVRDELGNAALIDAAAVIGGFDGITRIADAIGIPLEPVKQQQTSDFYDALGIGSFIIAKTGSTSA